MQDREKPRSMQRFFSMGSLFTLHQPGAHENHEQGIIVSCRLCVQRMRMMRVYLLGWLGIKFRVEHGSHSVHSV